MMIYFVKWDVKTKLKVKALNALALLVWQLRGYLLHKMLQFPAEILF